MDWKKESEMFNQTAEYYDQFRPSYPAEIINAYIKQANLKAGSKLLEIGAGSGKATALLANKGYQIVCVEPGKDLVDLGNRTFSGQSIQFVMSRFEQFSVVPNEYDSIFAAQSFHWVEQPSGYEKCAYALKEQGYLALIWNMYITYENALDHDLVSLSDKYGGFADFLTEEECEIRIQSIIHDINSSNLFHEPTIIRSLWKQTYTADEYYGFALTGNRFVQKSDEDKQRAYQDIQALAHRYHGKIERGCFGRIR